MQAPFATKIVVCNRPLHNKMEGVGMFVIVGASVVGALVLVVMFFMVRKRMSGNNWEAEEVRTITNKDEDKVQRKSVVMRTIDDEEEECVESGILWVNDVEFLLYHLYQKSRERSQRTQFIIYLIFLSLFTYTLISHTGLGRGSAFWTTHAVVARIEDRWKSITREKVFWDFMETGANVESGGGGLLQLYNLTYQTVASYNHILNIVRLGQHRVKPTKCDHIDKLLQNNHSGWSTQCYGDFSEADELKEPYGLNASMCFKDLTNKSAFSWSELSDSRFPGEEFLPWATIKGVHYNYPSQKGFYVDTYASQGPDDVQQFFKCLRENRWIDQATRAIHIKFFTFNTNLGIFLRTILMIDIDPAGVWRPRVESLVFDEIDTWRIIMESIVLAFVLCYVAALLAEIYSVITRTRSAVLWMFSVWRCIEVINLSIFLVVFYYKVNYWAFPHHELKIGPATPSEIKDKQLLFGTDTSWYDSLVFMRLDNTLSNTRVVSNLSAFNGVLVYLKVIRFFKHAPRLIILSDTIKDALSSLFAILVYLLLITQAYAMMGVSIWGSRLRKLRNLPKAWTYLLLSLLGSFDFQELYDVEAEYAYLFFVTYQLLVWLVLLNIVIGIVTSSYEKSRGWQNRMSGDSPVGPMIRNRMAIFESWALSKIGFRSSHTRQIRKAAVLRVKPGQDRAMYSDPMTRQMMDTIVSESDWSQLDSVMGEVIVGPEDATSAMRSLIDNSVDSLTVVDILQSILSEAGPSHLHSAPDNSTTTPSLAKYHLLVQWDEIDNRNNYHTRFNHVFTSIDKNLIWPCTAQDIYPKIIVNGKIVFESFKMEIKEVHTALTYLKHNRRFRMELASERSESTTGVDTFPWVRSDVLESCLMKRCPSLKAYYGDRQNRAASAARSIARQLCFLMSEPQLRRYTTYRSLISFWKTQEYRELMNEDIHRNTHLTEIRTLGKTWSERIFSNSNNSKPIVKDMQPKVVVKSCDSSLSDLFSEGNRKNVVDNYASSLDSIINQISENPQMFVSRLQTIGFNYKAPGDMHQKTKTNLTQKKTLKTLKRVESKLDNLNKTIPTGMSAATSPTYGDMEAFSTEFVSPGDFHVASEASSDMFSNTTFSDHYTNRGFPNGYQSQVQQSPEWFEVQPATRFHP